MLDTLIYLTRSREWVSCLVLIGFTFRLIRSSALPARPLPLVSGKPHGATTYRFSAVQFLIHVNVSKGVVPYLFKDKNFRIKFLFAFPRFRTILRTSAWFKSGGKLLWRSCPRDKKINFIITSFFSLKQLFIAIRSSPIHAEPAIASSGG